MKARCICLVLGCLLLCAANQGIKDVIGILQQNLPYQQFALLSSAKLTLPADNTVSGLGPYSVSCSGRQKSLNIVVSKGRSVLLSTTVSLRDGKPLVLGGFPSANGKHVLVILAR